MLAALSLIEGCGRPAAAKVAMLARQLVNARLAEADARRKLRVAARQEVDLRDDISHKDQKLRDQLGAQASQPASSGADTRAQLARAKAELAQAQRELAAERGACGGVEHDADLHRWITRLSSAVQTNRQLSNEMRAAQRRALASGPLIPGGAEESTLRVLQQTSGSVGEEAAKERREQLRAAVYEMRQRGVLTANDEENCHLLVECVQLLAAQLDGPSAPGPADAPASPPPPPGRRPEAYPSPSVQPQPSVPPLVAACR